MGWTGERCWRRAREGRSLGKRRVGKTEIVSLVNRCFDRHENSWVELEQVVDAEQGA